MATQVELAQLSAAAYRHTSVENRIDPPSGWTMIRTHPDVPQTKGDETGLSASVFRGPGGEIVIGGKWGQVLPFAYPLLS